MKKNLQRGFTLIELMIVVVIVAILAAVAYPSYQDSVIKTKRAEGRAALMQAMQQQERYYTQNNTYVEFDKSTPAGFKTSSGDGANGSYEISGKACGEDDIKNCIVLAAKPVSPFVDAKCGDLTLQSTGIKDASVKDSDGKVAAVCW